MSIERTTAYDTIRRAGENGRVVALPRGGSRLQRRLVTQELLSLDWTKLTIIRAHFFHNMLSFRGQRCRICYTVN